MRKVVHAPPKMTRAQNAMARFVRETLTDETPVSEDAFAAKVEKLAGGR